MKGAILKFYKITYPFAMLWMTYAVFFNSNLGWEFYAGMIAYVFFGLSMFDDVRGYRVDTGDGGYWDDENISISNLDDMALGSIGYIDNSGYYYVLND